MSEQDVMDQLARYARWVEDSTELALRPAAGRGATPDGQAPVAELVVVGGHRAAPSDRWRPARLVGFAAAVAVIASIGWALLQGQSTPTEGLAAEATSDPSGPLFVLPARDSGVSVTNGQIILGPDRPPFRQVLVVGTVSEDGYDDLITVLVGQRFGGLDGGGEPVALTGGSGELTEGFVTVVARRHGGEWISVIAGPDRAAEVIDVMEQLVVHEDGSVGLDPGEGRRVIESASLADESPAASTYFDIRIDGLDEPVAVETAAAPTPLLGAGLVGAGALTPAAGLPGWELARNDPDAVWNGLIWQATPNRVIAVSGHVPKAELRAVAESLEIVDEARWGRALPDHLVSEP